MSINTELLKDDMQGSIDLLVACVSELDTYNWDFKYNIHINDICNRRNRFIR
jgi:hypothetical protein